MNKIYLVSKEWIRIVSIDSSVIQLSYILRPKPVIVLEQIL